MLIKLICNLFTKKNIAVDSLRLIELDPNKKISALKQQFFIKAESLTTYRCFLENFEVLLPENLQITKKVTPGPVRIGTRFLAIPNFLTRPRVYVEITTLEEGKRLAYGYLEGSPFAGTNAMTFKDTGLGADVEVTLHYQISSLTNWFGWYLLGGKKFHTRLIIQGIRNLETLLEEKN
ncbi:MAG: hypothetical protein ACUZ77_08135 [Candidatus Brocadiales bacterium]